MVSHTRLNLRRLYLYLVLVFTFVFNLLNKLHTISRIIDVFHWVYKPSILIIFVQIFQIICSRRKIIYTFYLFWWQNWKKWGSSKSTESLTSRLKIFIFSSVYMTIDPGTSSAVASCLVWLNFCLPFSGLFSQDFLAFMPLQEFVVHFETGKNLWLTFKTLFFVFGSSIGDNGFEILLKLC